MANNKFRLTLTIFIGILLFLFLSGVLSSSKLSLKAQEILHISKTTFTKDSDYKEQEITKCEPGEEQEWIVNRPTCCPYVSENNVELLNPISWLNIFKKKPLCNTPPPIELPQTN